MKPPDERLAKLVQEMVIETTRGGRTREKALEIALNTFGWADQVVGWFEGENPLPRPIACRAGCHFCCYNQVELTPPEVLIIGHHVARHFSSQEKTALLERIAGNLHLKTGKSKIEIAGIRHELPCPLLKDGKCSIYPVRPLMCRAMHSLDAAQCEIEFKTQSLAGVEFYAHRHDLILSVSAGLMDGCRAGGCQSGPLELAGALRDFFHQENPEERWIRGEKVFRDGQEPPEALKRKQRLWR